MSDDEPDPLRARLEARIGTPLGGGPARAPDPVNLPMIRHWVDAFEDRNPVYLDGGFARTTRFGGIVAPPAMLQTWTMPRPQLEGIAERGGATGEVAADSPFRSLGDAGFVGTRATNSEVEFVRYLRPEERLQSRAALERVSERKVTPLGSGYFVTWLTTYVDDASAVVGRQRFRIFKFAPGSADPAAARSMSRSAAPTEAVSGTRLPPFALAVTATRVVACALASRDFMPVHHDREYARAQGAPDIFMNIMTTNGYLSRFATDWAGPEAQLRRISIRLGAPAVPGQTLLFTGQVTSEREASGERVLEVKVRAANDFGEHATGTLELGLPRATAA